MAKESKSKTSLSELLLEAKNYYGLQKEYLSYTAAESLTRIIGTIAIALVVAVVGFAIILFTGLALVHWIGEAIHNIALCYALFALFLFLLLVLFYLKRRHWVLLPLARLMSSVFIKEETEDEDEDDEE